MGVYCREGLRQAVFEKLFHGVQRRTEYYFVGGTFPCEFLYRFVPSCRQVVGLSCGPLVEFYVVFVGFVAVFFHRGPCNETPVRTPRGIHVVAFVAFGQVLGLFGYYVVDVYVRIGRYGGLCAGLFLACVRYFHPVGAPCELFGPAHR